MKNTRLLLVLFAILIFNFSCTSDDDVDPEPLGAYESGILISNEGPFNNGTGTVSFISDDLTMSENAIFNSVNDEDLGNIVQSIGFTGDQAYVVANVSNQITVLNRNTFVKIASFSDGLNNPRFMVAANGKGYVSNWGDTADDTDDYISIVNLETNAVENSIPVVLGPEKMLVKDNTIYVAHKGAFGQNNQISVIDATSNTIVTTITVGDVPNSMQFDSAGNLWVLAGGNPSFTGMETGGVLSKIDTNTNMVESSLNFGSMQHPNHLSFENNSLYYFVDGSVYEMAVSATSLPSTSILDGVSFYAMTVKDGRLYGTDAKDFASNGSLLVYDLNLNTELATITVGLIPGGIYFN